MIIKDNSGMEKKVTGLGQGIYNTVGASAGIAALLGAGNGCNNGCGGLFNLFGGNDCCHVDKETFYTQQIADVREMYTNLMAVDQRLCNLESRVSGDEIAIQKNFEIEQIRADYEKQLFKCYVDKETCDFVKAEHFLSPNQIADPYMGRRNVIATYNVPYCDGGCGFGYNYGYGNYGGF